MTTFAVDIENMTKIIKDIVKEYKETPYEINNGLCENFADKVNDIIPQSEIIDVGLEDPIIWGHVFIKYRGLYFDAEAPHGVKDIKNLPIFNRRIKNKGE